MKFWHSFGEPYFGKFSGDAVMDGVEILECLIRFGILLTPELLKIPWNDRAETDSPQRQAIEQERACFTLMRREELYLPVLDDMGRPIARAHIEKFGAFAIGLDPIKGRELGPIPVFYFYGDAREENQSLEVLFRLRELRVVMSALALIEAKAGLARRPIPPGFLDDIGFSCATGEALAPKITGLAKADARVLAECLATDRVSAVNMVDWIDIILNYFQTADERNAVDTLAYYQEREWRIVRAFADHLWCSPISLSWQVETPGAYTPQERLALRARLRRLNPGFFTEALLDQSFKVETAPDRFDPRFA